jgi:exonuclease V gamma subunit
MEKKWYTVAARVNGNPFTTDIVLTDSNGSHEDLQIALAIRLGVRTEMISIVSSKELVRK